MEATNGFPGAAGAFRPSARRSARSCQDNGYTTFWVGKNHNVPEEDIPGGAGPWPLQQGFDRFYGFLGGETNQWYPDLVEDNHFIEPPYPPRRATTSPRIWPTRRSGCCATRSPPTRPSPGSCGTARAPTTRPTTSPAGVHRQVPGRLRRRLRGLPRVGAGTDDREGRHARGHRAHPAEPDARGRRNPTDLVRPWDSLCDDEKRLFARMAEVFAGFSEYTDAQIGRIIDYLEQSGQLDNTLVFYCADNGASGEGSPQRLGEREQVLQRLARRPRREPRVPRQPRQPGHLQPLPHRLGGGVLDAVPDVQALRPTPGAPATRW